MLVYKCDMCDKTVTDIRNMHTVQMTDCNDMLRFDLCEGCFKELKLWMKNKDARTAERNCDTCLFDGMCSSKVRLLVEHNGCTTWTPKQTATKEGDGEC